MRFTAARPLVSTSTEHPGRLAIENRTHSKGEPLRVSRTYCVSAAPKSNPRGDLRAKSVVTNSEAAARRLMPSRTTCGLSAGQGTLTEDDGQGEIQRLRDREREPANCCRFTASGCIPRSTCLRTDPRRPWVRSQQRPSTGLLVLCSSPYPGRHGGCGAPQ